jgi:hypothetical protein
MAEVELNMEGGGRRMRMRMRMRMRLPSKACWTLLFKVCVL